VLPVFALVLALLVFAPDVALAGAWASPVAVTDVGNTSEGSSTAPAQLVAPAAPTIPVLPLLLLFVVATWFYAHWLALTFGDDRGRKHLAPPGRRGRAVLHAYLN